jgi:hypothetical protein
MYNAFKDRDPDYADARTSVTMIAQGIVMIIVLLFLCFVSLAMLMLLAYLSGDLVL